MISFSRRFISGLGGLRLFLLPLKRSRSGPESSRPSVCGGPHKWLPPDIPGGLGAERLPQCFTECEQKGTLGGSFVSVMTQVVGIGVSVMPEYSPPCLLHRPSTKPRKTEMNDQAKTDEIIAELTVAYWMELETVVNYLANSTNLDGVRAEEIKKSLAADVTEELLHATQIAGRVKTIGGQIPGSTGFQSVQATLQPPADSTDVVTVIKGGDRRGAVGDRPIRKNHSIVRRLRFRHARHVHHAAGRRATASSRVCGFFEGIRTGVIDVSSCLRYKIQASHRPFLIPKTGCTKPCL